MNPNSQFSPEFKAVVVMEVISGAKSTAEACREYGLNPELLSEWKAQFLEDAAKVFEHFEHSDSAQVHIAELERIVGRLTLELQAAKKRCRSLSK